MAKKRRRSSKKMSPAMLVVALILVVIIAVLYFLDTRFSLFGLFTDGEAGKNAEPLENSIEIHVIDVGQGDSILIKTPDGNVLIDGGPGSAESDLRSYLKNEGVKEIKYFFCTHPDEDHIGGADMIMNEFDVKNVVLTSHTSTTQTYEKLITAIENSSANRILSKQNNEYTVGDLKLKTLAPIGSSNSNNNSSIVLRAEYGSSVAILTGDADYNSEAEILDAYSAKELNCDFLKVGHHGSDTSSSDEWIKVTSPSLAAISCGKDNKYEHPHAKALNILDKYEVTYYRTDLLGSLVFVCDGASITLEK